MTDARLDLPQGTLDLLILKAVSLEPQHGWAISDRIGQISRGTLQIQQGSLYPALHRLERRGWIKATWGNLRTIARPSITTSRSADATSSSQKRIRGSDSWLQSASSSRRPDARRR